MSVLSKAPRPSGDDIRRVALTALAAALDDGKQEQQSKRSGPMKGVKTVAAGAALFVAGRAAYKGRHAIIDQIEQLQDGGQNGEEPEAEEDEDFDDEEPEAEEDEDFDDEEPEAEEDEDFDDEEPEAEEDEDFEDQEPE